MKKIIIFSLFLTIIATFFTAHTFADYQTPAFPSCTSPIGSSIAPITEGQHAIAGQDGTQNGIDTVYDISSNKTQVMQCFCPPTELNGIQTNWLDIAGLSAEEKQQLQNSGWVLIENGSGWGLNNEAYAAQNSTYVCNGQTAQPVITAVVQATETTNNNTASSSNSSSSSNNTNNNASSPNTPSSSLPDTGESMIVVGTIGVGLAFLAISFLLKKLSA